MPQTSRRSASPFVVLVGILALSMATPARAGLMIQLSTDGINWDTMKSVASGTTASLSNSDYHGFNIAVLSDDSNSPGTPSLAYLEGSAVHVSNNNAGMATLYIKLGDTGFNTPLNPGAIVLDSQVGGSVTVPGPHNAMTYQSYVDSANNQNSLVGFTSGPQSPAITGSPKAYNDDSSMVIASGLTATYSITESFKITLDKSSQIGFQSSTSLSAVPEPASLVLLSVGVLGLIASASRRRKPGGA